MVQSSVRERLLVPEGDQDGSVLTPAGPSPGHAERAVLRKLNTHLLPVCMALSFCTYLDQANAAFAAREVMHDTGLSNSGYGISALFFLPYALLQVPHTLAQEKFGAPTWLSVISLAYAAVAAGQSLVTSPAQYLLARLCMGACLSGLQPGVWLLLSRFYPVADFGEAYVNVASMTNISLIVGAPLAAVIMKLDGALGIAGWRWLFLSQAATGVALTIACAATLPADAATARFLSPRECDDLLAAGATCPSLAHTEAQSPRESERADPGGARAAPVDVAAVEAELSRSAALLDPRAWHLGFVALLAECGDFAIIMWAPMIAQAVLGAHPGGPDGGDAPPPDAPDVPDAEMNPMTLGILTAIPFAVEYIAMLAVARSSAKTHERRLHVAVSLAIGGLLLGTVVPWSIKPHPITGYVSLVAAAAGVAAYQGPFYALPHAMFRGARAKAMGIAVVQGLSNVGGLVGPLVTGLLSGGGDFARAMVFLGGCLVAAALLALLIRDPGDPERRRTVKEDDELA
ncbi:unnamed protein product [Pedinophyceae sp. YPF-701]|nr:unnamed protein product [Pedinophyceae sp. YPF-701]